MMPKDVIWFSHDSNARGDEKMLAFRARVGWQGYGLFWALCEMMFENDDTALRHSNITGLALGCNVKITALESVIKSAIDSGLFVSNNEVFWSERLRASKSAMIETRQKHSDAGKKGMESRYAKTQLQHGNNDVITLPNRKEKRREEESKEENQDTFPPVVSKDTTSPHGEESTPGNATTRAKIIDAYTDSEDVKAEIREFVKMRQRIKKPLTDHALELLLRKLDKLASSDAMKIAILQKSITGSYQGIYELNAGEAGPSAERRRNVQT